MKTCPVCSREFPDNVKFCPNDGQTLRAKSATGDLVGQVVADRYHITKKLGEGGMGAVYLGEHVKMGRKSAIKVMTQAMVNDPDAVSRFNREAANASRISHPNVCQIYDFGETPDGTIYLAMEFIEGSALTDLIEKEGALPPARAARILKQAADALAAAHDLSIVHRDLKPDNIMIVQARDGSDSVKVVDFGIAKAVAGDESGQKVTKTGLVVGTPEYMSPEQLSGDKLDGRSDIYSLGLVLYRMLTGVLPFQADSAQETMIKRLTDDPIPLEVARPDIAFPPKLQAVLDRALARMPSERYQRAAQFGDDVMEAVAGLAVPETRADMARVSSAATQLLDTESALKAITTRQAAKKGPPAAAPEKRFPLVPVLGGVGGVAALAAVAVFALGRGGASGGPDSSGVATANTTAAEPTPGRPIAAASPGAIRPPPPRSDTTPRPGTTAPIVTPPGQPPAAATVSLADSVRQMDDLVDAQSWDAARRVGMFIWTYSGASGAQKARAARTIANTHGEQGNDEQMINWYRNSLRYDPNNQQVLNILRQLGVEP